MTKIATNLVGKRRLSASEREAIQFMVALSDDDSSAVKAKVEAWLHASESNVLAWQDISDAMQPVAVAADIRLPRGHLVDRVFSRDTTRRTALRSVVGLGIIGSIGVPLTERFVPLGEITADHLTITGERRRFQLADGSDVVLGARSAIDVDFRPSERTITLRKGEMWIQSDASAQTPLLISTPAMTSRSPGGIFVARVNDVETSISAIDTNAMAYASGTQSFVVPKGRSVTYNGSAFAMKAIDTKTEGAWIDGLLFVNDTSLLALVARLRAYTAAVLRVDRDVANERVSGIFPLNDLPRALDLIETALNVVAHRRTPYWITIERSTRSV